MNRKGELSHLFRKYLYRKSNEVKNCASSSVFTGSIFFYEWSNINNTPKRFYTLDAFTNFLGSCGIRLHSWERDIIKNLKYSYITCKKGSKDLLIKSSYPMLRDSLAYDFSFSSGVPCVVQSKMFDANGEWFG